ncbi:MAG: CHRD domain-containing protein [Chloroflexota bacterium]
MQNRRWLALLLLVMTLITASTAAAAPSDTFVAHLAGRDEVPPTNTLAQGQAIFHLNDDETALGYKLIVANIENVVASHIHCAPAGVNGPVGVFLYGAVPPGGGRVNGVIAEGTITDPIPTNGCNWTTLAQVVDAIESGNAYVNVHTNDGVAPTNTGPGDFPGGEIRGQIR